MNTSQGKQAEATTVVDADGTTYEPWSDGWAVGFKATHPKFGTTYIYLNPSSDSDDGVSTVFMYQGDGLSDNDEPVTYVNTFEAQDSEAHSSDSSSD